MAFHLICFSTCFIAVSASIAASDFGVTNFVKLVIKPFDTSHCCLLKIILSYLAKLAIQISELIKGK